MLLVKKLVWDSWNVDHIARHDVTQNEVEEICHGVFITRQAGKDRVMLVGSTTKGRMLAVVLGPRWNEDAYYPVTARPASRKERRLYQMSPKEVKSND